MAKNMKHYNQEMAGLQQLLAQSKKRSTSSDRSRIKSEILFQQFWDISVDGIRVTDEMGKMIAVNESFCRIVGMSKKELEGQLFTIIYYRDQIDQALELYHQDLKDNALKTHFETERQLWDERTVWLEFSNSIIELDKTGKVVLSVIRDITKRKKSEIELLRNEQKYRMLFHNLNDAVFVNHLSGEKTFTPFFEVNDVACERLGFTRSELQQINLPKLIPDQYHQGLNRAIDHLLSRNHVIFEVMQVCKNKRQIPVEISAHLFEFDNKPTVLSIARDITDRKRAEKQLQDTSNQLRNLSSRLQEIREEERTMIARELHDELGQVLTVLKIQVSLCANKLNKNQDELRQKIDFISSMLDQMVETVQKITSKLRPDILDELGLIPAIEWQAEEFQKNTGIRCDLTIPGQEFNLQQDTSTAIFRILQEALTNVARHAHADKISIILKEEANLLILEVTDNGIGIHQRQIEDPGSLGILGMKERAAILGGKMTLHGVHDKGTHVKVEIPVD